MLSTDALRAALKQRFAWRSDGHVVGAYADYQRWWKEASILGSLGPALAGLFEEERITAVIGPDTHGTLLGPLVAAQLGVGFVRVAKELRRASHDDAWLRRSTPPDYQDRTLELFMQKGLLAPSDRVLFVDQWIATGGQAIASRALVQDCGAHWVGAAVIVDGLELARDRRNLNLRGLLHLRELG